MFMKAKNPSEVFLHNVSTNATSYTVFTNLFSVFLCCVYLMLKYLIVSQALQVVPYHLDLFVVV